LTAAPTRSLLGLAERRAPDLGLGRVHLYTHEAMTEDRAIYEARGYVQAHRIHEQGFARVYHLLEVEPRSAP
jgi:hypothetical protein